MARGPDPKPPGQRRNRTPPARGEWVDLEPLKKPVLPVLPKRPAHTGPWSARTRSWWAAVRKDPVTGAYGPSEIAVAIDLAYLFEEYVRDLTGKLASEVRLRMDGLGLTPKGKRDLRWRVADEPATEMPDEVRAARERRSRVLAFDPGLVNPG